MAAALSTATAGVQQIVIAEGASDDHALTRAVSAAYLPFAIQLRVGDDRRRALAGRLPFVAAMQPVDGASAAYVCRNFSCRQPVTSVSDLERELRNPA
jgi:uncharacterized protein